MQVYIFPGQGAQFPGMGLDMYEKSNEAQELFEKVEQNSTVGNEFLSTAFCC